MKYTIQIWQNDELLKELTVGKKDSQQMRNYAFSKALMYKKFHPEVTSVDLCKNGEAWMNLITSLK